MYSEEEKKKALKRLKKNGMAYHKRSRLIRGGFM